MVFGAGLGRIHSGTRCPVMSRYAVAWPVFFADHWPFAGLVDGSFFLLASGLHELIRNMRMAPHISMDCPHRLLCAGSVGVFPPPGWCPMNLTIKQLVVILTTLLLLAVGVVYEAFSMFPSMF